MDLWLLRHAEAEDRAASGEDEDRNLTAGGLAQVKGVGRGLAALETGISLILTSPYRRARQTADAVAPELSVGVRELRALEPGNDPEAVLAELDGIAEDTVLLVGHEPLLGSLLGRLVTGDRLEIPLKKAGVAMMTLTSDGRRGSLHAFLPARVLERLGRGVL